MRIVQLGKSALGAFGKDDCATLAAAIAYAAFFSIFPAVLGAVALVGAFIEAPDVRRQIIDTVVNYLPASGDFVSGTLEDVVEKRGSVGVIAALLLVLSVRGVMQSTVHALDRSFETPHERGVLQAALLVMVLIFGVGLLLGVSLVVTAVIQALASMSILGFGPYRDTLILTPVQFVISAAINFAMFALLYRAAPNMRLTWRDVVPGAALAAVLFEIAKLLFVLYVRQFMGGQSVYGAIGSVMVLMSWFYFSGLILLFGAELSSEYVKLRRAGERAEVPTRAPVSAASTRPRSPAAARLAAIGGTVVAFAVALWAVLATRRARAV